MQQKAIFQICVNHTRCRRLCGFGVGENEIIVCFDIKFLYTDKHDDSNSTLNCSSKNECNPNSVSLNKDVNTNVCETFSCVAFAGKKKLFI